MISTKQQVLNALNELASQARRNGMAMAADTLTEIADFVSVGMVVVTPAKANEVRVDERALRVQLRAELRAELDRELAEMHGIDVRALPKRGDRPVTQAREEEIIDRIGWAGRYVSWEDGRDLLALLRWERGQDPSGKEKS